MSNKKRKNREKQSETILIGSDKSKANETATTKLNGAAESNESKAGLFAYLKNPSNFWVIGLVALFALGALGAGLKYLDDAAKQEKAAGGQNQSFLSKINPFTSNPLPTPTPTPPQLSKEYIYAGGKLLAVEDANASAAAPTDLAVWRKSTSEWWVMGGQGSQQFTQTFGTSSDAPLEGDYDGDGKTDFCGYKVNRTTGVATWTIYKTSDGATLTYTYSSGSTSDKPQAADFDGDGKTDAAVYKPSTGIWNIQRSSDNVTTQTQFGLSTDVPAPKDYDGDGKADIAYWRNSNTTFYVLRSSDGLLQTETFGTSGDVPVSGDYDGDGKADFALKSGNQWLIKHSSTGQLQSAVTWEQAGDTAVQNDYDGDGKVDIAVWRDSNGNWYIRQSSLSGQLRQVQWGISGDKPVPSLYRR